LLLACSCLHSTINGKKVLVPIYYRNEHANAGDQESFCLIFRNLLII
jgi:hypothetical protein